MKFDFNTMLRVGPVLTAALADGKLTPEEIMGIAFALGAGAGSIPGLPGPANPAPDPLPPVLPFPLPTPQTPPAPRLLMPSFVQVEVTAIELGGTDITLKPGAGFTIVEEDAGYRVVLGPESPTTNLPIHSRIDVSVAYCDVNGKPFRFEAQVPPALHLYHTAQWRVSDKDGNLVAIGPGDGAEMLTSGVHVANIARYSQTGGMDPTVKIPAAADKRDLAIGVSVPVAGIANDKPILLPTIG